MYITDSIHRAKNHTQSFKDVYLVGFYSCGDTPKVNVTKLDDFMPKLSFLLCDVNSGGLGNRLV
jgi:hypothetical protein